MIRLLRNEIPGQGVLYAGSGQVTPGEERQVSLYPPNYLIKYSPPRSSTPMGAWTLSLHTNLRGLHNPKETKYFSVTEVLDFLKGYFNQEVSLETEDQMQLRIKTTKRITKP